MILNAELADVQKSDLQNYSFADTKVVFPSADVAVASGSPITSGNFTSGVEHIGQGKIGLDAFRFTMRDFPPRPGGCLRAWRS